ncbi:lipopolysaccharide biosynthesis protein [Comamonas thiooxydans]|uniref:lipopolysaccharide biosynthesis protein n=1 Tax=Comamonas thiooxydans TaxID=363952 RepID=UPI000A5B4D20|nr:lipopolysaccharide biosynthesis protein [Comamonas thiooxydans]TZG11393.1 lipopolysaccharide biosynthesis protein [Comamonas thiooxydans]
MSKEIKQSVISDGFWLLILSVFAGIGQLIGIRFLTEISPAEIFGRYSLILGLIILIANGFVNPTMQAVFTYYPKFSQSGEVHDLWEIAQGQVSRLLFFLSPVLLIIAIVCLIFDYLTIIDLFFVIFLIFFEVLRLEHVTFLNAKRSHKVSSIWIVLDSWLRPLFGAGFVYIFESSLTFLLAGSLAGAVISYFFVKSFLDKEFKLRIVKPKNEDNSLNKEIWLYTLPLLPLGIIGWISGMSDRYIIGGLLSATDVGLYVAIYSLASKPILMMGSVIESAVRPVYVSAVIERNFRQQNKYILSWSALIIVGVSIAFFVAYFFQSYIARVFLGESYRDVSHLLPWIIAGNGLLVLSYVANRICYTHKNTRAILVTEFYGALISVGVGIIFIYRYGLNGAALAVPIYFGAQCLIAFLFARKHIIWKVK